MRVAPPSGHALSAELRGLRLPRPCSLLPQNNFNGPVTFELPPVDTNLNVWYVGVGVQYHTDCSGRTIPM